MMTRTMWLAVALIVLGGGSLLSAEQTDVNKIVCEARNGGTEHGCQAFDCETACPGWTQLEPRCQANVFSCWGFPPEN